MQFLLVAPSVKKRSRMIGVGLYIVALGLGSTAVIASPTGANGRSVGTQNSRPLKDAPDKTRETGRERHRKESQGLSLAGLEMVSDALRMQVSWTMVRSKVTGFGATSRNENYRELWHLWRNGDGVFLLMSPRAKIAVDLATPDQSLVTTEGGLASLLGLLPQGPAATKARGNQVSAALARPVSLQLLEPRTPVQAQFNFGGEESYAIQFEIASLTSE